ncbi:SMI1/KNR4 family protein [Chitinophaga pinensis]|uniref:Knr4/Smi1-like domain-containing protein n=1 Tax=Chitinophaga pinensis (strain ATCC 43595 / DSM 2588 / LMG 13176 / NBRC 15968 / NCIMB 11800 / UQM 2034) TaxID=485918 RepID=A0A979FZL4_CHIPD|nr:SMI1/KNR4 family protein [Chitinophaga pinensis]ACU58079.1 hypothetical protein Cpin_0581 [Chitinophaga pinensis DSM 2588]
MPWAFIYLRSVAIKELVNAIGQKHRYPGIIIHPPATQKEIADFEERIGFELPAEFREFYFICNGFECTEDIFTIFSLATIQDYAKNYGSNWYNFADYMIASETWTLRQKADNRYEIFYEDGKQEVILSASLHEFLAHFLQGDVFDEGGLHHWYMQKLNAL